MGAYTTAWLIIVVSAIGGGAILYWLLRKLPNSLIRKLIIGLSVTFFVVPASLPAYPEQLAPAFVVLVFEAFFQIDGSPGSSLRVLLISLLLVAVLIAAAHYLLARFGKREMPG